MVKSGLPIVTCLQEHNLQGQKSLGNGILGHYFHCQQSECLNKMTKKSLTSFNYSFIQSIHLFNKYLLSIYPWRRKWNPTPISLPDKFHGQRSMMGYSPGGHKDLE